MSDDADNPEALSRMRAYEPPPEGFDPQTAPQEVLRRHGLPRRPDHDREPELAWLWKRSLARPPTFVRAELAIDKVMSGRDPQGRRKLEFDPLVNGWVGPSSWAGIVRELTPGTDFAEPASCVFAELRVPQVYELTPDQPLAVAFWVGIDWFPNSILQAGVTALVDPGHFGGLWGAGVSFYVWTEWFPAYPCYVANFPVSSGDIILIMVRQDEPDVGHVFFNNLTTGMATSILVYPPDDVTLAGTHRVEWIVEAATEYLPVFSTVNFDTCIAGTPSRIFFPRPGGIFTEIQGYIPDQEFGGIDYTQSWFADSGNILVVKEKGTNWL
jgi:hypothetical protein